MAPEKKANKRKAPATATSVPAVSDHPPSKKSKKTQEKPVKEQVTKAKPSDSKPAKENGVVNGAKPEKLPVKVNKKPAKEVKPRKRAADFLSDDEDVPEKEVVAAAAKPKAEKETQPKKKAKSEKPAANIVSKEKSSTATEKTKKTKDKGKEAEKLVETAPEVVEEEATLESDADSDAAEDDQTLALIRGFESSGEEDASGDEGFEPGQEVPRIPDSKKAMKAIRQKKKKNAEPEEPGTVYVGRIPHGFYEDEMRAYFSQFGDITRLRLSRNRTTGSSKHYAFIEFASTSVAKVVAGTMQNYLMFGHILKCKYIPNDKVHPAMWKGANRRFKKTPWNQIEKRRLEGGKSREEWSKAVSKESSKRAKKAEKMKAMGYEYEIPELKAVEDVPVAVAAPEQIEDAPAPAVAAIEDKEETPKKAKSKGKAAATEEKAATPKSISNGKADKEEKKAVEPVEVVKKATEKKESKKSKKKAPADTAATPEKPAKDQKLAKNAPKVKGETAKPGKQVDEKPKKTKKAKA
ncbi:ribosomal biogenesis protein Gar2 [Arthroderma uncinatum]|uniref:ribosomal biogenesis protein Gar2 n=1 Tax=Arthroderma uncinatum TaxID=74035 RepID=UPI00144A7EFC|nr:ribosomal biogenesis protein Gar2 [Arthroderma uncinatum]KAF3491967.1 ribosomal biogenesis protein Gar2 [Arthroderma uncinatum]